MAKNRQYRIYDKDYGEVTFPKITPESGEMVSGHSSDGSFGGQMDLGTAEIFRRMEKALQSGGPWFINPEGSEEGARSYQIIPSDQDVAEAHETHVCVCTTDCEGYGPHCLSCQHFEKLPDNPKTVGEWEKVVAQLPYDKREDLRRAFETLGAWKPFRTAFGWTQMFILQDELKFANQRAVDRRACPACVRHGVLGTDLEKTACSGCHNSSKWEPRDLAAAVRVEEQLQHFCPTCGRMRIRREHTDLCIECYDNEINEVE